MKSREKTLVGLMLLSGGFALAILVGLPQWEAFSNHQSKIAALNDELHSMETQKASLTADIEKLEKNSAIPSGIDVQVYTEKNREQIIKGMLNTVVNLATGAGNLFISLAPSETPPSTEAPPPAVTSGPASSSGASASAVSGNASASGGDTEAKAPPPPVLNRFSYDLSVRGSYQTLQGFLRAVAQQKALMEISAIRLENELTSTPAPDSPDPLHPIRLHATVRLALQPEKQ